MFSHRQTLVWYRQPLQFSMKAEQSYQCKTVQYYKGCLNSQVPFCGSVPLVETNIFYNVVTGECFPVHLSVCIFITKNHNSKTISIK